MSTATEPLLTAEQFRLLPDPGYPTELVRGRLVKMNMPAPRHGHFCSRIVRLLGNFVEEHDLGWVMCNDSAVITERDPDTVRGADVCYYSYSRLPKGPLPEGYVSVVPELVFEVRSPTDRWPQIHSKVGEYQDAGVLIVCVLDPQKEALMVYYADELPRGLTADDELNLSDLFGVEFRVPVRRFFE